MACIGVPDIEENRQQHRVDRLFNKLFKTRHNPVAILDHQIKYDKSELICSYGGDRLDSNCPIWRCKLVWKPSFDHIEEIETLGTGPSKKKAQIDAKLKLIDVMVERDLLDSHIKLEYRYLHDQEFAKRVHQNPANYLMAFNIY